MDPVAMRYHSKRLLSMVRYKGLRYTLDYLGVQAFYFSEWFAQPLFTRLFPRFMPYPHFIEVEVTTRCNLRCIMCEHTYWNEKPRDMTFEEFKGIVDQFPDLKWIGVTGIGASFLNKDFIKMLKYVKSKSIYSELYDTFFHIDEKVARELIDMSYDRLIMSIDGATKEIYEKIRVGSSFGRVTGNLRNLIRLKREMGAHYPEITFHYIISKDNIREIPQFINLVHSLTAGEDVGVLFTGLLHGFEEIEDLVVEVPEEMMQAVKGKGREYGIKVAWNKNIQVKEPISRCTEWTMPFIFVDGTVVPCCATNEGNVREFQKRTSLGNIFEQDFRDIWYGEKYKRFRQMLHEGKVPAACSRCPIYDVGGER